MPIEIILCVLSGMALGVLTGIIPGLHPNTVLIVLGSAFIAAAFLSPYGLLALVASLAVTNSIVNFIPTVFFGAPEPDTCLSVLPAHRFLLMGRGYEALYLTVVGGIMVLFLTLLSAPFLLWLIPLLYEMISGYIHWLLIGVLAALLINERGPKILYSLLFFLITGISGVILLSAFPSQQTLFPSLTGLFGISVLAFSTSGARIPRQKRSTPRSMHVKGGFAGWIAGMFVGMLPGIGSAQAGVLANTIVKGNNRDFITALGGINTANVMFSFIMLYTLSRTRTGAAVFISEILGTIDLSGLVLLLIVSAFSCLAASLLTLWLGKKAINFMAGIDYRKMNFTIIGALFMLVFMFTGLYGLLILIFCSVIGISCTVFGVKRMYMMGFLMLPTILHFSGLTGVTLSLLLL